MPLLAAQTQATNQVTVAVNVTLGQVLHSLSPAQNVVRIVLNELTSLLGSTESKLTLAQNRIPNVIMLVGLQVLGQLTNALREQGDLCFRGTGVGLMKTVLGQDFLLLLSGKSHENLPHQYFSPHEKTAS